MSGQEIIYKLKKVDYKMVLNLDAYIDRTIFFYDAHGKVERRVSNFLLSHLKPEYVFFDIGANSGYYSLLAASIIRYGEIHAFEPVSYIYKNLLQSVKLNNLKNIKVNNLCVGYRNGFTDFFVDEHSDVSSIKVTQHQKKARLIKLEVVTLEEYCKRNKVEKIDVIKIDTEGSEKDILFGSKKLLETFMPLLIVEFSNITASAFNYHPNEIYDFLSNLGYRMYNYSGKKLKEQVKKSYYKEDLFCFPSSRDL